MGILVTFLVRFLCHFLSGWIIWEVMWPNELGWAAPLWSFVYNGSYMLPEIIITEIAAFLLYKPLEKYWLGQAYLGPDLPVIQGSGSALWKPGAFSLIGYSLMSSTTL